jgi:hypothetical protein
MSPRRGGALGATAVCVVAAGVWIQSRTGDRAELERGAELAATYCSLCHLEPQPEILPKGSWEAALGYMGFWLGMDDLSFLDGHPDFARINVESRREGLERENALPAAPLLSEADWATLRNYYVSSAPEAALPQTAKPPLARTLERFDVFRTSYRPNPVAVTTMVSIHEEGEEVFLGDSVARTLTILGSDGRLKGGPRRFRPEITPIDIEFVGNTAFLASIGDLMSTQPPDARLAHIAAIDLAGAGIADATSRVVLDRLIRMADMRGHDFNGDGVLDFIICGFGSVTGSVSLYESQADGSYAERVLLNQPGAVKAEIHDFNGDGRDDIVVLLANAREGLQILENRGDGEFVAHQIFETHPAYGHTYLELHDFDADGQMDVLVVNGDNVDSDPYNTRKNYHGVRIYLNRGNYVFEEAYFYPMYGAFVAKAADFDADGDLDIAAVAFYPDYDSEQPEAFTYLQNEGGLQFSAYTSDEVNAGRWMTMDIGDVDGDDDVDVVLGGGYIPVGMFAHMDLYEQLARTSPPALILKNTLH